MCSPIAGGGELLRLPPDVMQVALLPVAHYVGDDFRPAPRLPVEDVVILDHWGTSLPG